MAFDPDAYLAAAVAAEREGSKKAFDPDTWLAAHQAPEPPRTPKVTAREAARRGLLQGATAGLADELAGVGSWIGNRLGKAIYGDRFTPDERPYQAGRDEYRGMDELAAKAHPAMYGAGTIGGALATLPVGGIALKGAKGLARAGRTVGLSAAEGAAFSAGSSEADLTKGEAGKLLRDTGKGALIGVGAAAGGQALATGVRKIIGKTPEKMRQMILNMVAEGAEATTPRDRKRLHRAGDKIVREIMEGPDYKEVLDAIQGPAQIGQQKLLARASKIGASNSRAYGSFEKAGRDIVDMPKYQKLLDDARSAAIKKGKSRLADGIRAFQEHVMAQAHESGGMRIRQLRGLTTEAQAIAESKLGGLSTNFNVEVGKQVKAAVTRAMDQTLEEAAKGSRALEKAAATIRKGNSRLDALLTMAGALERRAGKEATAPSGLVKFADKVSSPVGTGVSIGIGGLTGAASGETIEDKIQHGIIGGLVGASGRLAASSVRAASRAGTRAAIEAARTGSVKVPVLPGVRIPVSPNTSEIYARALGRLGAREAVDQ